MAKNSQPKATQPDAVLQELMSSTPTNSDTASALVEIYERSERVYRAAVMAGQPASGVAAGTDQLHPI